MAEEALLGQTRSANGEGRVAEARSNPVVGNTDSPRAFLASDSRCESQTSDRVVVRNGA